MSCLLRFVSAKRNCLLECRTYTTDYVGSLQRGEVTASCSFEATNQQMDRDMLMERAPILFTASVPLYESEMDDHGVSACSVRVRITCVDILEQPIPAGKHILLL